MTRRHAPEPAAVVPEATVRIDQAVHDLRNGMNALLMNSAVLGARSAELPETLRPFVERIAVAGRKCNEQLARVLELVEEAKPKA